MIVSVPLYALRTSYSLGVWAEMSRFLMCTIQAVVLLAATTTSAEARHGFQVPIVIPGFSSGVTIRTVLDLPDIPALRRSDEKYVDLGYLQKGGGKC